MKKFVIAGIAAAAFLSAPALAAPPAAPMFDWTGFYMGLNVGYGWGGKSVFISPEPQPAFGVPHFTTHPDPKGFIGGTQIGFNQRLGPIVYGVEADFSGADINGHLNDQVPTFPGSVQVVHEKLDWLATLRGRIGVMPAQNLLLYGTGGLAVGHYNLSSTMMLPLTSYPTSGNNTNVGWTLGAGIEWILTGSWSAKFEYLYYDLGSHTLTALPVPGGGGPFLVTSKFEEAGNIVRVGLNYKFGSY